MEMTARELLTFAVNGQPFAIDVMAVREVCGWRPATPTPRAPAYLQGLINLRGAVLPIVDLNVRLGYPAKSMTNRHVIVVGQTQGRLVGAVVEEVIDIIQVDETTIRPTPSIVPANVRKLFGGVISQDDGSVLILLSFDALLPLA